MIVQCPACRALVGVTSARIEPGRAGIVCSECGATTWLAGAQGQLATPDVPVPRAKPHEPAPTTLAPTAPATAQAPAPTANGQRPTTPAWLDTARERIGALPPPPPEGAFLVEAFDALFSTWDDAEAHKQLVKKASVAGQLAALGLRYRAVLDARPDEPMARQAQQDIITAAMATLPSVAAPVREPGSRRFVLLAGILTAGMLGALVWYVAQMLRS